MWSSMVLIRRWIVLTAHRQFACLNLEVPAATTRSICTSGSYYSWQALAALTNSVLNSEKDWESTCRRKKTAKWYQWQTKYTKWIHSILPAYLRSIMRSTNAMTCNDGLWARPCLRHSGRKLLLWPRWPRESSESWAGGHGGPNRVFTPKSPKVGLMEFLLSWWASETLRLS